MRKLLFGLIWFLCLSVPAAAIEITAPEVPKAGLDRMPQNTDTFGESLLELVENSITLFHPELESAAQVSAGVLFVAMMFSLFPVFSEKTAGVMSLAGTVAIAGMVFRNTNSMISFAAESVREICEYGKLLCPVMTTALAAQGGITSSAALYAGTTAFISLLNNLISRIILPMVYLFLLFSVAYCATGEEILKKAGDAEKSFLSWLLKAILITFTTYMSVTGVVSGTADAAALKAARVSISSVVPVVGSIISDASESVLVSIGIMKNAAGIYGILAVLSIFMGPFLKVGVQYLLLKLTAVICSIFADKKITTLINDFSTAMGLLLAMVASGCILILISTVCFMKGIG